MVSDVLIGVGVLYPIGAVICCIIGLIYQNTEYSSVKQRRFAVLICARNEEQVIGNLLDSLALQDYPKECVTCFVVAHNCTDQTARIARKHGAVVFEWNHPMKRTKGNALHFGVGQITEQYPGQYEALCIFDADNLAGRSFLKEIYDIVMYRFHRRYRLKKAVNLCITSVVAVLGITSFLYGLQYESFKTIFRWMTVDGTLFTTFCAIAFILVNLYEILGNTELTSIPIYYIRLSSVVAESVKFGVTLISQLPFFDEHIPIIDRYDYFVMHIVVPILSVTSFLTNDSSIGKLKPMERWRGT